MSYFDSKIANYVEQPGGKAKFMYVGTQLKTAATVLVMEYYLKIDTEKWDKVKKGTLIYIPDKLVHEF